MRIWSIHPKYLDAKGLVALWREGLLAQKVLAGKTKGYRHHPQLIRFRSAKDPLTAIGTYLHYIEKEAHARDYHFDRTKIIRTPSRVKVKVTSGQLRYEFSHLLSKLILRSPETAEKWIKQKEVLAHPCFEVSSGAIEEWENR